MSYTYGIDYIWMSTLPIGISSKVIVSLGALLVAIKNKLKHFSGLTQWFLSHITFNVCVFEASLESRFLPYWSCAIC